MQSSLADRVKRLGSILKIEIKNKEIFLEAMTHSSYFQEKKTSWNSNERLEFLGDSVLGFIISQMLFERLPQSSEGNLSVIKSELVSARNLAEIAINLSLCDFLFLSNGEELSGARSRVSTLADLYEALIGAVLLDSGYESVKELVKSHFKDLFSRLDTIDKNPKTRLQEKVQEKYKILPEYICYETVSSDDRPEFMCEVKVKGEVMGRGSAGTKKEAEILAASEALLSS